MALLFWAGVSFFEVLSGSLRLSNAGDLARAFVLLLLIFFLKFVAVVQTSRLRASEKTTCPAPLSVRLLNLAGFVLLFLGLSGYLYAVCELDLPPRALEAEADHLAKQAAAVRYRLVCGSLIVIGTASLLAGICGSLRVVDTPGD